MSFVQNQSQQITFSDSYGGLTKREQAFLDKSWAKYFGDFVFPSINEEPYSVLYSTKDSRPNCPVNILLGALIIKEITGQSDDEILMSLMFDVRYQYALHTTSFEEQPLSDRSLGRFRERCHTYEEATGTDLIKDTVVTLSSKMAEMMKIDASLKRMDSMMVASNIRKLSRLELIYNVCANLVEELGKNNIDLPKELKHFLNSEDRNLFIYQTKSDDTESKMDVMLREAKILKDLCGEKYDESSNYQMLIRVLKEQTVDESGTLRLRKPEDGGMDSNMIQNPTDPDATFRFKAGINHRGYSANIVEAKNANGDSIIENYQYEKNNHSDHEFLKETIDSMDYQEKETTIVADGGYSGDDLKTAAAEKNISIVNTNLSGKKVDDIVADFVFNEDGTEVVKCPGGFVPKSCSYNKNTEQCLCSFHREHCSTCPYKDKCHPKEYSKTYRKVVSKKSQSRAIQQRSRSTDEFKKMCHFRNGVETVPSVLRRKYHVDTMPVRGKIRSKMFFGFKVAALNITKFCNFMQSSPSYACT